MKISEFYLDSDDDDDEPKPKIEINMDGETEKFILPSGQEIEKEKTAPLDMTNVKSRIEENISALKNFKDRREDGKSRPEYMELLRKDLMYYYGQPVNINQKYKIKNF